MGKQKMRVFKTGATRNLEDNKIDLEGFTSPIVLQRYGEYMNKHRIQADGKLRDSDNWQAGFPLSVYMKSGMRHFQDWWLEHRGFESREGIEDALCGLLFNVQGYLFEILKTKGQQKTLEKQIEKGIKEYPGLAKLVKKK